MLRTALLFLCLACFSGLHAQKKIKIEKLGPGINTPGHHEVAPVISLDGRTLYFTRLGYYDFERTLIEDGEDLANSLPAQEYERYIGGIYNQIAGHTVFNPFSSEYNQDIWVAKSEDAESFTSIEHPGYPLNNPLPNSIGSLTPAGNEVILINQFVKDGGMKKGFSISRNLGDGSWTFPEDIVVNNYHNSGPDVSMCMSADGSVMILSLEKPGGYGRSDLYLSLRTDNDNWTTPINLGSQVNTSARETTPFLSEDKRMLFFSSSRSGNSDIFMIKRKGEDWFNWTKPLRYRSPINSKKDDSRPYFNAETGYLYFTSTRDGSSDIFRAKIAGRNPYFVTVTGRILNSETGLPVSGQVMANYDRANFDNFYKSSNGKYKMKVPKGVPIVLTPSKEGFIGTPEDLFFEPNYVFFQDFVMDLYLNPSNDPEPAFVSLSDAPVARSFRLEDRDINQASVGDKIDTDPIFFEQSKAIVRQGSYATLDHLGDFLSANPFVRILVKGHTDNLGRPQDLQKLSNDRAKAVKDYLVKNMYIHPLRISAHGLGSSQPIADNSTEQGRRANRRVEIEISEITTPTATGMR
ncbi:MAG: OmpA family protein [Saprospiraceae bacterium]|nr:OmpA family protein [Saprospiraceae bacterium]